MRADFVSRALDAAGAWLAAHDSPESVIAAHEAKMAADDSGAKGWVRRVLDEQDASSSWGGDLLATAEAVLVLHELRRAADLVEQDPGIGRGLDWLRQRRGEAGAWSDGCTPERHELALCHHFLGGFFSPGPPEPACEQARTRGGALLSGDAEIRLVASMAALRAMLSWGDHGPDTRLHLNGLRTLVCTWEIARPPRIGTAALLSAVHALALSPVPEDRAAAECGVRMIAARQRGDGSWVETDAFHALEVFTAACDAGIAPEHTRRALEHGARLLTSTQQADGSWGREHGGRRALIAWRTLRRVVPEAAS